MAKHQINAVHKIISVDPIYYIYAIHADQGIRFVCG